MNLRSLTRNRSQVVAAGAGVGVLAITLMTLRRPSAASSGAPGFGDVTAGVNAATAAGAAAAAAGFQSGADLGAAGLSAGAQLGGSAIDSASLVAQALAQSQAQLGAAGIGLAGQLSSDLGSVAAAALTNATPVAQLPGAGAGGAGGTGSVPGTGGGVAPGGAGTGDGHPGPAPAPAPAGQASIRFLGPTTVYARTTAGFIGAHTVFGTPGLVVPVNVVHVPLDPVRRTGGTFWEMKGGAKPGWLVSSSDHNIAVVH